LFVRQLVLKQRRLKQQYVKPEVSCLFGRSGCGKTRSVYERFGYVNVYSVQIIKDRKMWFDGYDNEKVLLLDDFQGQLDYKALLRLLDGYPIQWPVKGGFIWPFWSFVVLTSVRPLEEWYPMIPDQSELTRRITFIVHFS